MTDLNLTPEQTKELLELPAFLILRDEGGGSVETVTSHVKVIEEIAFQIGGFVQSITMVHVGEAMLFYRDYDAKTKTFGDIYA